MNGILAIELAQQHQQSLLDYADRSRLATRQHETRRSAITAWWRRRHHPWRGVPRRRAGGGGDGVGRPLASRMARACSVPPSP